MILHIKDLFSNFAWCNSDAEWEKICMMKLIKTTEAAGHVLCHDLTQIIKDEYKGARFHKGHIVTEEDIPVLLAMGKENLYIWEKQDGMLHEDEAAAILYEICAGNNPYMSPDPPKEGKIDVIAQADGLLVVDTAKLRAVNSLGQMMIASRHSYFPVRKGEKLAGTRIIPLLIESDKMQAARDAASGGPVLALHPFRPKKAGIITTGSEVLSGRVADTFTPVLRQKLAEYDAQVVTHAVLGDDTDKITQTIREMTASGVDIVLCSGGMSVDPDDKTPLAIKNTQAHVVSYGAPVLPGAMFMLAYMDEPGGMSARREMGGAANGELPRPAPVIMGLPGCVMYAKRTIFDLILPRVMADIRVSAADLASLGHGGLCLSCPDCTFPNCGFGKGV